MAVHSYPSIYNLGHAAVADLLKYPVIVEEKIDGSQFSFMKMEDGEIQARSKGAQINVIVPEGLFIKAVEAVKRVASALPVNVVFRAEYLAKPKHNILVYCREPHNNLIIFDINPGLETYLSPADKLAMATEFDFEVVPILFEGVINSPDDIRAFLQTESVLGGQKIEGVVIKPADYALFGKDKKVLMAKFVSEAFKEVHASEWKREHGTKSHQDVLQALAREYATPARWAKALIHAREEGQITDSPRDIPVLMAAIAPDVMKECEQEIREKVFQWAWPQLRRMLTKGLPEWYKDELLKKQFETQ